MKNDRSGSILVVAALASAAGCDGNAPVVMGPRGGTVASADGRLTLTFPAGALDRDTVVTVDAVDDAPAGAVGPTYAVHPRGTGVLRPVAVTYDLTGDAMTLADPRRAVLVVEKADGWFRMADHEVDADLEYVTASATFLSSFGVVEED